MKLIEKKEQKKMPELIWGAKYKVISGSGACNDIQYGETVVLATSKVDGDGDVRVFSETEWDYLRPEQLQLITEEIELIAGNEYLVKGNSKYGKELNGETVELVYDADFPFTGDYVVVNGAYFHGLLVKPEQLISAETTKNTELTYVIEFTESELKMVYASVGTSNNVKRKELLVKNQIDLGEIWESFDDVTLYTELADILQGEDK